MEQLLLNIQRQKLHNILVDAGIDPASTNWSDDKKDWTVGNVNTLEAGNCFFTFKPYDDNTLSVRCRPSPDGGVLWSDAGLTWNGAVTIFHRWADLVKSELQQEDPWSKYGKYVPPESITKYEDNSAFSHTEAEEAAEAINKLLEHIKNTVPEYKEIEETYDEIFQRLAESAKKGTGRIDWSNQFIGLIISLCIALSLSPEKASEIWNTWLQLITKSLPFT